MSKSWNPGRQTVELRPSRIRREPVRLATAAPPRSRESEVHGAVFGIALIALALAAAVVGLIAVTTGRDAAPARTEAAFGFCRSGGGPSCVLDGQTFRMGGQVIVVAGVDTPDIHPSRCSEEARLGILAAVRLRELLNRGPLTLTAARGPAPFGTLLRHVKVRGRDVGAALVASGAARELVDAPRDWCQAASSG